MAEPTAKPPPLSPLPLRSPLVDRATLLISRPWSDWLGISRARQGGANAPSNSDLDTTLGATQEDLAQTQADLTQTQADLVQTQNDLAATQAELAATQADLTQTQAALAATQAELDQTQTQLASDLPPGTALSVPRYQADGTGVETTPGLMTTAEGKLGVGVPVPVEQLEVAGALHLGAATAAPQDGTLHWNGSDFEGRKGGAWISFTAGTSGLPPGTPLAVPRYTAAGEALETAPGVFTSANAGQLQLCDTATPPTYGATNPLTIDRDGATQFLMTAGLATGGVSAGMTLRSAPGPVSAPTATQLGTRLGYLAYGGHDGSAYRSSAIIRADGTEAWTGAASGTVIRFQTMANGGTTLADRLRIDGDGNLNTTGSEMATGLRTGLALGLSVAPTTDKANTVQLWIADLGGLAGKASLHLRSEDSGIAVFGTQTGLGTHCAATLGSGEVYRRLNVLNAQLFVGVSSVQERPQALLAPTWVVSTDSSRAARLALSCHDATAAREFLRGEADGSSPRIGFLGAGAVVRQTLPAAATDATTTQALANALRTALITFGLGG